MSMKAMQIRIPADLKEWLERQSERNQRSQNAEIIETLRFAMSFENKLLVDPEDQTIVSWGGEFKPEKFGPALKMLGYRLEKV